MRSEGRGSFGGLKSGKKEAQDLDSSSIMLILLRFFLLPAFAPSPSSSPSLFLVRSSKDLLLDSAKFSRPSMLTSTAEKTINSIFLFFVK